jgi:hypothetical protein
MSDHSTFSLYSFPTSITMLGSQLAYLIIIGFYVTLSICSLFLLSRGACGAGSSQFSKTRVVLFLVFLCTVLRISSFASLYDDAVARSTQEAKRFLFDFPGLLAYTIFTIYFVEVRI